MVDVAVDDVRVRHRLAGVDAHQGRRHLSSAQIRLSLYCARSSSAMSAGFIWVGFHLIPPDRTAGSPIEQPGLSPTAP